MKTNNENICFLPYAVTCGKRPVMLSLFSFLDKLARWYADKPDKKPVYLDISAPVISEFCALSYGVAELVSGWIREGLFVPNILDVNTLFHIQEEDQLEQLHSYGIQSVKRLNAQRMWVCLSCLPEQEKGLAGFFSRSGFEVRRLHSDVFYCAEKTGDPMLDASLYNADLSFSDKKTVFLKIIDDSEPVKTQKRIRLARCQNSESRPMVKSALTKAWAQSLSGGSSGFAGISDSAESDHQPGHFFAEPESAGRFFLKNENLTIKVKPNGLVSAEHHKTGNATSGWLNWQAEKIKDGKPVPLKIHEISHRFSMPESDNSCPYIRIRTRIKFRPDKRSLRIVKISSELGLCRSSDGIHLNMKIENLPENISLSALFPLFFKAGHFEYDCVFGSKAGGDSGFVLNRACFIRNERENFAILTDFPVQLEITNDSKTTLMFKAGEDLSNSLTFIFPDLTKDNTIGHLLNVRKELAYP